MRRHAADGTHACGRSKIKMEEIKTPKTLKQDPSMKKQEYKRGINRKEETYCGLLNGKSNCVYL